MWEPRPMRQLRRYLAVGFLLLAGWLTWRYFFPQPSQVQLRPEPVLGTPGALMVIAPHPDDEVLAAGGLIQDALRQARPVYVVMVTNGDGFRIAAERWAGKVPVDTAGMIAFGRRRREETLAALTSLGVGRENVIFLDYPDEGTTQLWADHWTNPYRSPFTGAEADPYVSHGHPYTGASLLNDLTAVLRRVRPALVAFPHPSDAHPDHWAVHNFMEAALEELRVTEKGWAEPVERLYLVHRGDWPAPKGLLPGERLVPPGPLVGGMTEWASQPLTPTEVAAKEKAIRLYTSQMAILRRYMLSFARSNELYGSVEPATVTDGADWLTVEVDPAGDTLVREALAEGDVLGVDVRRNGGELQVRVRLRATPTSRANCTLGIRAFRPETGWSVFKRLEWPGTPGATVDGKAVLFHVPLTDLGNPQAMMVGAATTARGLRADRTAWRLVRLR